MSNPGELFGGIEQAINQDGNTPAHQEAALAAKLYGIGFGSMFDCFNKAWNGDPSANQQQGRRGGAGGGANPFQAVVFGMMNHMTDREMQRMQEDINQALQQQQSWEA